MKWKNLEKNTLIFLITNASFLLCGISTLSKISQKATILSMLLSSIISYLILAYFFHINQNKTLSLTKISKKLSILMIPFLIILLHYSLQKILSFLTYNVVSSTSYYLLIIAFLAVSGFAIYKGFTGIIRAGFIYLIAISFLTVITFIALFPKMDFQNVLPILDSTPISILKSMFLCTIFTLFPYTYLFHLNTSLSPETIKSLKRGYIANQLFIIFYVLMIFSILGLQITNLYPYPEVSIFKKVSFLNIIDRMESVFSISYFLSLFIYFVITLYGFIEFMKKFLTTKKEGSILIVTSMFLFFMNEFYQAGTQMLFLSSIPLLILTVFACKSIRH